MGQEAKRHKFLGPILMKEPIYVYEPNTLDVFESVELAERYLEPWNLADNIYFDSTGRVLEAIAVKGSDGIERCVIQEASGASTEPEKLKGLIVDFLTYLGRVRDDCDYELERLAEMTLEQLVEESLKFRSS